MEWNDWAWKLLEIRIKDSKNVSAGRDFRLYLTCFLLITYIQNTKISPSMNTVLFKAFSADEQHQPSLEACWEMRNVRPHSRAVKSELTISYDPQVIGVQFEKHYSNFWTY